MVTHRVANLMGEGISPHSILALTFTNKAADEMKKRLRTLAGDAPVWMGTFHGYCARFLRRHAELIGLPINYSIYDPSDAKTALKEAVERSKVSLTHLNADQIARAISDLKNKLITPICFGMITSIITPKFCRRSTPHINRLFSSMEQSTSMIY